MGRKCGCRDATRSGTRWRQGQREPTRGPLPRVQLLCFRWIVDKFHYKHKPPTSQFHQVFSFTSSCLAQLCRDEVDFYHHILFKLSVCFLDWWKQNWRWLKKVDKFRIPIFIHDLLLWLRHQKKEIRIFFSSFCCWSFSCHDCSRLMLIFSFDVWFSFVSAGMIFVFVHKWIFNLTFYTKSEISTYFFFVLSFFSIIRNSVFEHFILNRNQIGWHNSI